MNPDIAGGRSDHLMLAWPETPWDDDDDGYADGMKAAQERDYVRYAEAEQARLRDYAANVAEGVGCTCSPTPERYHFVYYGITEPGSAWEFDPACPVHACPECGVPPVLIEEHAEQIGYEERARDVVVTDLACGHQILRPG